MKEYIDRERLKNAFHTDTEHLQSRGEALFELLMLEIDEVPAEDVAPVVRGEWILKHIGHGHYWECSVCHTNPCIYVTENTKFCPNCGAKMDGGKE